MGGKELVKNQLKQFEVNINGKYYGYDLINQVELNGLFVFRSYLLKYDRQPIRIIPRSVAHRPSSNPPSALGA
ncbi:MAG: hypothetical protein M3512_05880 [Bacteroidota bacterium]|nr:hypothetical protein [Bacteroidota bacterium]